MEGGGDRGLHNEELHCAVFLTKNYLGNQMKNEMGRACGMYRGKINAYTVLVGKPEEKRRLGRRDQRWRIILKLILKKCNGRHGLDRSGFGQGQVAASCKCSIEPLGSIKCGEFLDKPLSC